MAQPPKPKISKPVMAQPAPYAVRRIPIRKLLAAAVVLVAAYGVWLWASGAAYTPTITGPTTIDITNSTSFFGVEGSQYGIYLVSSPSNTTAQVSITQMPTFLGRTLDVTLYQGNVTYINTQGQFADMQMTLEHQGGGKATVLVAPVPLSYDQQPTSGRIAVVQTVLGPLSAHAPSSGVTASVSSTTTVSATTAGSTTSATTTISGVSSGRAAAMALLQKSAYYPAMVNYTALYANTSQCTVTLYNTTYRSRYSHVPSGPNTYLNISALVPYGMNLTITNTSSSAYTATYSTLSHMMSLTGGPAMVVTMNVTSNLLIGNKPKGIFYGLNLTTVNSGVKNAQNVGNACGIYISSCQSPC